MRYTQLRAFDAVVRAGGISRAAQTLGLSQPALTIQVRALERAYDVSLLRGRGNRVEPTRAGRKLFELTRQMFGIEEQARSLLAAGQTLEMEELLLGADSPHVAMPLVAKMINAHPGLSVAVHLGNTPQVWAALTDQRVDAAVVANPALDERMISVPLGRQQVVVLVPAGHPLAKRRSLMARELDGQAVVLREEQSNTRRLVDAVLAESGVAVNVVLTLDSREAVHEAVAAGLGIGFALMREAGQDGRIRALRIGDARQGSEDFLVAFESQIGRRVLGALFDLARDLPNQANRRSRRRQRGVCPAIARAMDQPDTASVAMPDTTRTDATTRLNPKPSRRK